MVGIYLLMQGDLNGQAIMIFPLDSALNLADLLLDAPPGTATSLGELERSALAEVGNLTVSYFLNAMSALTGKPLRPSPPAVMVDMLGAILDVVAVSAAATSDELLIVETMLQEPDGDVQGRFWVMPDPAILA
jgi:chemotaxis protein CheC